MDKRRTRRYLLLTAVVGAIVVFIALRIQNPASRLAFLQSAVVMACVVTAVFALGATRRLVRRQPRSLLEGRLERTDEPAAIPDGASAAVAAVRAGMRNMRRFETELLPRLDAFSPGSWERETAGPATGIGARLLRRVRLGPSADVLRSVLQREKERE